MIKLIPDPTFKAQVPFTVAGTDVPAVIEIEFAYKSPPVLAAWWEACKEQPIATGMADVIKGWTGVVDESGADVPYSPEGLSRFIGSSSTRGGELLRAYFKNLTESRLKN